MQAGVNKIWLYEDNNLSFFYHDDTDLNKISALTTSGQTIEIDNCKEIEFDFDIIIGRNYKALYDYEIKFNRWELTIDTIEEIETIKESIYGWKVLILFYDGTYKFYDVPFFCSEDAPIEVQESMVFQLTMSNRVPTTKKHLNYETIATLGFKADTTLISADSTLYSADYST